MRRHTLLAFFCIFFLAVAATAFGQAGCNFNIAGDWESTAPGQAGPNLYHFTANGAVTAFSNATKDEEPQKLGRAQYRLAETQNSRTLEFKLTPGMGCFPWHAGKMEITHVDQASFTTMS